MSQLYEAFLEKYNTLQHWKRICTLFDWDMYTQTPPEGYDGMAETLSFAQEQQFALSTSKEYLDMIEQLANSEEYKDLPEGMQYTIRILNRDLKKRSRIPAAFNKEYVETKSQSLRAWEKAKRSNDYAIFQPWLQKIIDMTAQSCGYTDPGKDVYEVLVDQFEEGMDTASIDRAFAELKEGLLPMLDQILAKELPASRIQAGTYDIDAQKKVQDLLLNYIGFKHEAGVTAESEHPFTLGFSRYDLRVTNHYHLHDPLSAMFSAIHEGGHAIFGQNVAPELMKTEADDCCYMGIHESQSRFFENILGRRRSFWVPIYSKIQELLPDLKDITLDEFMVDVNRVACTPIRTDADEVTYALHIMIRYEIERMIFKGEVDAASLPEVWNKKTQEYLHFTPETDALGVLQDMHWSDGSFGYFPSYLLGSIYDGMFLEAMEADLGPIDPILERGDIGKIREWLSEKIHQYGSLRLPAEVLQNVCGRELTAKPLLKYFADKYLAK